MNVGKLSINDTFLQSDVSTIGYTGSADLTLTLDIPKENCFYSLVKETLVTVNLKDRISIHCDTDWSVDPAVITLPAKVFEKKGFVWLSITGHKDDGTVITTNAVRMDVEKSNPVISFVPESNKLIQKLIMEAINQYMDKTVIPDMEAYKAASKKQIDKYLADLGVDYETFKKNKGNDFSAWFDTIKGKLGDDEATALYDTLQYEFYGVESDTNNIIHGSSGAGKVCVDVLGNTIQEWMDLADIAEIGNFDYGAGKKINGEVLTQPARLCTKTCFTVEPNKEYSIECSDYEVEVYYATADYTFISYTTPSWGYKRRVLNTPNDCQYIRVLMRKPDNTAIGTIQGKLRLSCVTEPSIENPLLLESAGNRKNLVDINKLTTASLAPDSTGWNKIKILLDNGTYTCSIKENKFQGISGTALLMLTNDKGYAGTSQPTLYRYYWIGRSDSASACVTEITFKVTEGCIYMAFSGDALPQSKLPDFLPEFQIEVGSQKTDYLPADKYEITLNSCGKNLINAHALDEMEQVQEATRIRKKRIYLKNGTYTWSRGEIKNDGEIYYCITDDINYGASDIADGCFASWIYQSDNTSRCNMEGSFTVTKGYIFICYRLTCEIESDMTYFQIEYGEKKTSYEAYQEDTQTLVLDDPLRSIGDVCDEIKDGKLIRRVGRIVVDGNTPNMTAQTQNSVATYVGISGLNIFGGIVKCNKLPYTRIWDLTVIPNCVYANERLLVGVSPEYTGCAAGESPSAQAQKFKAFLNANPLEILYKLKEPVIEDFQAPAIRAFPNHTTIRTNYEVSPQLHSSFNRHEALDVVQIQVDQQAQDIKKLNIRASQLNDDPVKLDYGEVMNLVPVITKQVNDGYSSYETHVHRPLLATDGKDLYGIGSLPDTEAITPRGAGGDPLAEKVPYKLIMKKDFVFIVGQIITPEAGENSLTGQAFKLYPPGFTKDNCVVISLMGNRPDSNDSWSTTSQPNSMGYVMGNGGLYASLQSEYIAISRTKSSASEPAKVNNFKLVLMKI